MLFLGNAVQQSVAVDKEGYTGKSQSKQYSKHKRRILGPYPYNRSPYCAHDSKKNKCAYYIVKTAPKALLDKLQCPPPAVWLIVGFVFHTFHSSLGAVNKSSTRKR